MAVDNTNIELQAEIDRARERGKTIAANEPRAIDAWYDKSSKKVFVELSNDLTIGVPYEKLQGLQDATVEQLIQVKITPSGYGLHWEVLDVDLGVPQIVAGLFGTKAWMAELGRQGGKSKSEAKAQASRKNGSLGGRPRKQTEHLEDLRQILGTEKTSQPIKDKSSSRKVGI
jgi:Protein of unknown function (DUF2442)